MYIVFYDTFGVILGGVLITMGKVLSYTSRQLNPHEKNYPTYDSGLTKFMFVLKLW